MRRKHRRFALSVAATALAATATHAAPPTPVDVATADNAFGFRLLGAVQKKAPAGNVVLSPVSAALDLAMALNGATGETRQQMLTALSLGGGSDICVTDSAK